MGRKWSAKGERFDPFGSFAFGDQHSQPYLAKKTPTCSASGEFGG